MASRVRSAFQAIKTEGALLPSDLLKRIHETDKSLDGLKSETYHLDPSERFGEVTLRAWTACREAWTRFQKQRESLPESDRGTTLTRDVWLLRLFQALDYGRLPVAKPIAVEDKTYPISHEWRGASHSVPIHLISFRYSLEKAVPDVMKVSAHSMVQEALNRSEDHLWGFVSNGLQLRILRDNVSFTRAAYVEFDLEQMFESEIYSDFVMLWMLCHQSRVEADKPELCWLEKWHQAAKQQGTRALDKLRDGVENAIKLFGQGFLAHPANTSLRERLGAGSDGGITVQAYYRELLHLVYRLIFLFVAEDRDLLLDPKAEAQAKDRYRKHYALSRIRQLAARRRGTRHDDLWQNVQLVMRWLYKGEPRLGLPALGSMLFSDRAMPVLDGCAITNEALLPAIRELAFTQDGKVLRPVDYKNLGSEELGSVYESLLELLPDIDKEAAKFELRTVAGSERKTTGSYYTPSSLVNCLLDSALDPVLDQAIKDADAKAKAEKSDRARAVEKAILDLKVCDPACGSGHFLIAAANRIAKRLAAVRTGDDEPSPESQRHAFRDVVGHCIYGVDINVMAVELCKVNLWLESIDPGRPLSFLDHRILCGNALIGATPRLIREGIPDEAFEPIEGDDKAVCREYKRRNKDERKGQMSFQWGAMPEWKLGNLAETFANVLAADDESLESLEDKEKRYAEFVKSTSYENTRLLADAWCAAFVWRKDKSIEDCITHDWLRRIEANPHQLHSWMRDEIGRLRGQYQFLHWHLAFPDVFHAAVGEDQPENERAGWNGGFGVVLGNPPWERVKLQEKEWFAVRRPMVAAAGNTAKRKHLIELLESEDPDLVTEFRTALRRAEGDSHFLRHSGLYPFCGRGDVNLFAVFAECMSTIVGSRSRVGCILPSGIATDDTTKLFFQHIAAERLLVSLFSFENEEFIFPAVHHAMKFCLLTLTAPGCGPEEASFVFYARCPEDLSNDDRVFRLSSEDIGSVNPNTRTCPVFRTSRDALLVKRVYRSHPVLLRDGPPTSNPWGVQLSTMFHMANDSQLFIAGTDVSDADCALDGYSRRLRDVVLLPVYEAKMARQYDHRGAHVVLNSGVYVRQGEPDRITSEDHLDPYLYPSPRYWIPTDDVDARMSDQSEGLLGFYDITASTNERTMISALLPKAGVGHTMPLVFLPNRPAADKLVLLSLFNSYAFDYLGRQKLGGIHYTFFVLKQLPIVPPEACETEAPWLGESVSAWIIRRALELSYTAWDLEAFAHKCGYSGPPFRWDEERRFVIRCELDAVWFYLYGFGRSDVGYILETFSLVKRKEEAAYGYHRTKQLVLDVFDQLTCAAQNGEPFTTALRPPPGPP